MSNIKTASERMPARGATAAEVVALQRDEISDLRAALAKSEQERDALQAKLTALASNPHPEHIDHMRFGGYCEKHVALQPCQKCRDATAGAAPVPSVVHKVKSWGNCTTCGHDKIPGESCARKDCPEAPRSTS